MKSLVLWFALVAVPSPAHALSPQAREFMDITKEIEPVQCEKRRLRRAIALAEIQKEDPGPLRKRFADLDRDPRTAKLEKRLAQLEPQLQRSSDPEDLRAISLQQREAFYRCE
ncbi:MAG TPA: hypothetical protein VM183_02590 [Burkholderiales bacterium]|nr:hypothetical protein [Burkholderiales bacterium]